MLSASTTSAREEVTVRIIGSAETELLDQVAEALRAAHEEAAAQRKRVVVDLRELVFASSSCLKVLATWLVGVTEIAEPFCVVLRANARHAWQQRSIPALVALAPELVTVENA